MLFEKGGTVKHDSDGARLDFLTTGSSESWSQCGDGQRYWGRRETERKKGRAKKRQRRRDRKTESKRDSLIHRLKT